MKKVKVVFILIIFVVTILLIPELSENKFDPLNDVFANSLTCSPIPAGIVYWLRGENNANDFFTAAPPFVKVYVFSPQPNKPVAFPGSPAVF